MKVVKVTLYSEAGICREEPGEHRGISEGSGRKANNAGIRYAVHLGDDGKTLFTTSPLIAAMMRIFSKLLPELPSFPLTFSSSALMRAG